MPRITANLRMNHSRFRGGSKERIRIKISWVEIGGISTSRGDTENRRAQNKTEGG